MRPPTTSDRPSTGQATLGLAAPEPIDTRAERTQSAASLRKSAPGTRSDRNVGAREPFGPSTAVDASENAFPVAGERAPAGLPQPDVRGRLVALDLVRGVAALIVCLQHLRNATLVDFPQIASRHAFHTAFYFVTNLGHESVMVFFVLSGYFVGGSVVRAGARFDPVDYLLARSLRLWCVLVPCLVLTWGADRWLAAHAPGVLNGAFAAAWHSAPPAGSYDGSWQTALGNLLFLQTVAVPVYGSNGPLWSLANEAWYYLLFPLAWSAFDRGSVARRGVLGLLAVAVVGAMPASMRWLFAVWLLGVGVYALDARRLRLPRGSLVGSALLFAAAITASRLRLVPGSLEPLADYVVGIAFALFCLALVRHDGAVAMHRRVRQTAFWLSDISFSLYLCHFPLVLVIGASRYADHRMQPDLTGLLTFAGWLALLLGAGHAMWWCFEKRTPALRGRIRRLAARRRLADA